MAFARLVSSLAAAILADAIPQSLELFVIDWRWMAVLLA